jgi:N-acetylneuraminate synthase/N,N'-diacetyllegionaminate synthase
MNTFAIDQHLIEPGRPTFVIAEIGVNHDGSLARAMQLVRHAADCGADAVKLQIFRAKSLMHPTSAFARYQKDQCGDADPAAMLRRYELAPLDLAVVIAEIRRVGLVPLATPFSLDDVETAARLDLPAIKIASPDLVNYPLLERCTALGKPLFVSTGAATMSEVSRTVRWLNAWRAEFALLHCVSSYPTPESETNLCWITELQQLDAPVGYSDHTTEEIAGAAAVMLGACIVEKHLTHDRGAPGPDHAASADPQQFARYVRAIRTAERLRGRPGKRVLPIEQDVRHVSRQSLVLARPLPARHVLTVGDLVTQRPGTGLPASLLLKVIGRRTSRPLPAGTLLESDMIEAA